MNVGLPLNKFRFPILNIHTFLQSSLIAHYKMSSAWCSPKIGKRVFWVFINDIRFHLNTLFFRKTCITCLPDIHNKNKFSRKKSIKLNKNRYWEIKFKIFSVRNILYFAAAFSLTFLLALKYFQYIRILIGF